MNAQAIQTAEILVRFANAAQDGKPPNIRTSDGTTYGVKPVDFGRFQPGAHYRIEYVEKEGRGKWKGRTFRDIVKCERKEVTPSAMPASSADRSAPPVNATSELYFVTRLLAASIAAGNRTSRQNLVEDGKLFAQVYRDVFGVA